MSENPCSSFGHANSDCWSYKAFQAATTSYLPSNTQMKHEQSILQNHSSPADQFNKKDRKHFNHKIQDSRDNNFLSQNGRSLLAKVQNWWTNTVAD